MCVCLVGSAEITDKHQGGFSMHSSGELRAILVLFTGVETERSGLTHLVKNLSQQHQPFIVCVDHH